MSSGLDRGHPALKVLLVDDDLDDFVLTRDLLSEAGRGAFHLDHASDPDVALESMVSNAYDVYLLDYNLGHTDGLTLMRQALEEGCTRPIIFLTGQEDFDLAREALLAGGADYLDKGSLDAKSLERSIRYSLERHRAAELQRRAESEYRTLAANLPNGAVFMFDLDLVCILAEGVGLEWFGMDKEVIEGSPLPPSIPHEGFEEACRAALSGSRQSGELTWMGKAYSYHTAPVLNAEGHIYGGLLLAQDISDLKRYQERIESFNYELEQHVADRTQELVRANEEMEGFCYTVSHDLRAPLRAIMASSMILLGDYEGDLDEEARTMLQRQAAAAKRLGQLIDDLLRLSRLSRGELQKMVCDLSHTAREVAEQMRATCEAEVHFHVSPGIRAEGDPRLLRFVIENLFDNACKFRKPGESVTVEFTSERAGGEEVYVVRDRGIGFEQEYVEKIFKPFERLVREDEFPGTGIGLANVKRIVERHGGRVWAEGRPGQGATFYFTL
jgi:signal transduction histidine kinase/CheY-like chemotaxis protein